MHRILRRLGLALAALAALLLLTAAAVYVASQRKIAKTYDVTVAPLTVPTDSAAVARGAHLAQAVTSCVLCHAADGGGMIYADMGPMGVVAGPNLTSGRGGLGTALTDDAWVRALRHGVGRDGRSLIAMPSEVFVHLSDEDLGAIIAYFRQLPPVDRTMPRSHFGPLGRALLAAGKLNILVAPKTPRVPSVATVARTPARDYGRYLAEIGGCHGCHGHGLSGGRVAGPPGLPPASNLTPSGPIASWTEADFARVMRTGERPAGPALHEFMPWRQFAAMTDEELHALWEYLRGVPAKPFGNK